MCEILGFCGAESRPVNGMLREFFSHSVRHPNGWGLAVFYGNAVSLEKEPEAAYRSAYLRERLRHPFEVHSMIAHIRLATRGNMEYENCHPFVKRDSLGRAWTLAHNGTLFDCPSLDHYFHVQEGQTDSERILCCLIDEVNRAQRAKNGALSAQERFDLVDGAVRRIAAGNKINLLIYDGELMYVHTNYAGSLYWRRIGSTAVFATVPLDRETWEPVPFTRVLAFRDGQEVFRGVCHGQEYVDNPEDTRLLFMDYGAL